jgi:uncharacterized membrane protein YdbT with pleckstrin-like domain
MNLFLRLLQGLLLLLGAPPLGRPQQLREPQVQREVPQEQREQREQRERQEQQKWQEQWERQERERQERKRREWERHTQLLQQLDAPPGACPGGLSLNHLSSLRESQSSVFIMTKIHLTFLRQCSFSCYRPWRSRSGGGSYSLDWS